MFNTHLKDIEKVLEETVLQWVTKQLLFHVSSLGTCFPQLWNDPQKPFLSSRFWPVLYGSGIPACLYVSLSSLGLVFDVLAARTSLSAVVKQTQQSSEDVNKPFPSPSSKRRVRR